MAIRTIVYASCNVAPLTFTSDVALQAYLILLTASNRESPYKVRVLIIAPSFHFKVLQGYPMAKAIEWKDSIVDSECRGVESDSEINDTLEFYHRDFQSTARRIASRILREESEFGSSAILERLTEESAQRVRPHLEFFRANPRKE